MAKSKLPKELTTVTPLSKLFAGALFVFLPIVSFLMGMNYQRQIDSELAFKMKNANNSASLVARVTSTPQIEIPEDWKTYTNKKYAFNLQHPANLTPREIVTARMSTITLQPRVMVFEVKAATQITDATDSAEKDGTMVKMGTMEWTMIKTDTGTTYEMEKNDILYTFSIMSDEAEVMETAEMILSSVSFVEPTPTEAMSDDKEASDSPSPSTMMNTTQ